MTRAFGCSTAVTMWRRDRGAWKLRKPAYELTFASAVGLELFAYGGGDRFGVCHIHDDESLARVRRLCEVICGTSVPRIAMTGVPAAT